MTSQEFSAPGHGRIVSFRDLHVWSLSMDLAIRCYDRTLLLPADERFGLCAQIRRAAVSIPANIAEGHANGSNGVFIRHLQVACGSQAELETLFALAMRLGMLKAEDLEAVVHELARVGQMLHALHRAVVARRNRLKKQKLKHV